MDEDVEHDAWLAKVDEYIALGDRSEEPRFVGRGDLFALVANQIDVSRVDAGNRTVVIYGAPGAGKSAFLRELAHRLADSGDGVPVVIDSSQCTPWGIYTAVGNAVGVEFHAGSERTATRSCTATLAGLLAGRAGGSRQTLPPSDFETVNANQNVPWDLMAERFGQRPRNHPVVLLCDEAQALDTVDPRTRGSVRSLHHGNAMFPIVPVFAGLPDTPDVLGECGVTRSTEDNEQVLQPLSDADGREYVRAVLDHLDADGEALLKDALVEWITDNADGWPQHLRIAMSAMAREMRRKQTPRLRELEPQQIKTQVDASRNAFYSRRLQATTPASDGCHARIGIDDGKSAGLSGRSNHQRSCGLGCGRKRQVVASARRPRACRRSHTRRRPPMRQRPAPPPLCLPHSLDDLLAARRRVPCAAA